MNTLLIASITILAMCIVFVSLPFICSAVAGKLVGNKSL